MWSAPSRASRSPARPSSAATAIPRRTAPSARSRIGIGTSEVEHVLATQTLIQQKAKNMLRAASTARCRGRHRQGHHPRYHRRDRHRRRHRPRHRICWRGDSSLSMEGRMTICNMSIEGGARAGLIAPGPEDLRLHQGPSRARRKAAPSRWRSIIGRSSSPTRPRISTARLSLHAGKLPPIVSWGTSPSRSSP